MNRLVLPLQVCLLATMFGALANSAHAGGPEKLKLGDIVLKQNGTGFRKKGLLTLYEGSLYLVNSSADASTIIRSDQPMAIRLQITSGFVSQVKMLDALNQGFQHSTVGDTAAIAPKIQQFRQCFSDPIQKNDVFVMSYIPGTGVLVHKNGTQKGIIAGREFKAALFSIWLGDRPADKGLRKAMLGK